MTDHPFHENPAVCKPIKLRTARQQIIAVILILLCAILPACGSAPTNAPITPSETLTSTQVPTKTQTPSPTPTTGPRPTLTSSGIVSFSILHTNDFHVQLLAQPIGDSFAPGAARLAYFIKDHRNKVGSQNMLLLDAGDFIEGDFGYKQKYYAALLGGDAALGLYEKLGYQAVTVGNHELFFGESRFFEIIQEQRSFQFLAANLYKVDKADVCTNQLLMTPYEIYDLGEKDGPKVRVAVIGDTLADMPSGAVYPEKFCVGDPVNAIASFHAEIKQQEHADVIVVLSHNGYEADLDIAQRLIDAGTPVDIIIGGHSHTFLEEPGLVGQTYVVQAGDLGRQVGLFELTFDRSTKALDVQWAPHNITDQIPEDPEIMEYIEKILP